MENLFQGEKMRITERVHIIPIGDDNLDRIIIPIIKGKADRVYLITMKEKDVFSELVKKTQQKMKDAQIEVKIVYIDMQNFKDLILILSKIIKEEHINQNQIYLSTSTGGNLAAAATMFVSTLFHVIPYFCIKDFQNNTIKTDIIKIPSFHLNPPSKNLILFLKKISQRLNKIHNKGISKKECLHIMKEIHPKETFSGTSGDYNKLKFKYLDKLIEKNFINVENQLRGKVSTTEEGILAMELYSLYYDI